MRNARPESEGKQLWRRCPRLRLPNRLARQGSTRHFAGKGGGWGETEREGERASQEDRGRERARGARARAARFKRRHTS